MPAIHGSTAGAAALPMKPNMTAVPRTKGVTKKSAGNKDEKREELEYDRLEYVASLPESAESKIEQKCQQKISNWLVGRRACE